MNCILSPSTDPCFNLALEEVLLKGGKEEYAILSINSAAVITGKHQCTHREADTRFVTLNGIPVIRRISGGGTVFHDPGNLNFSFIRNCEEGKQIDFRKHTEPVIGFLRGNGIDARFEGKNDIRVNGLKISGNAEHVHKNRVLHHGTLLFDSSLDHLRNSIRKDITHYNTRGVASNPSSVMNLKPLLNGVSDIFHFRDEMLSFLTGYFPDFSIYHLSPSEKEEAEALAASKFRTWEWNFAYGPEYTFTNDLIFEGQRIIVSLDVKDGLISECRIKGSEKLQSLATRMKGMRHMPENLSGLLRLEGFDMDVFSYF
ncbi:MAG TPA: lipoate--protein ligase [Bacteroidales bacterium]|nr:lipoate--protein ligase [Bacteroidales bacterium]